MPFEFATAARIVFGCGVVKQLPDIARSFGKRALVVTGRSANRVSAVVSQLDATLFLVSGEPTVHDVRIGATVARQNGCDVVIGIGGGSPIDAAKAIAIVATNSGEPLDYLEVVGKGKEFEQVPLPFLAVPTTAGTGAEVTRNAVLGSPEHAVKASLRSSAMLAKVAIVDPELTFELPPYVTAYTGLDALTQLIEPFVSSRANAMVDMFCRQGMGQVRDSLPKVFADGRNRETREAMAFASLLGGLSLANAGLGVVHGFAAPLGGVLHAPHGAICAAILPHGVAVNIAALRGRSDSASTSEKYAQAARILTGDPQAGADDLPPWLSKLTSQLGISGLGHLGLTKEQIPFLVAKAAKASSMKANPVTLTAEELTEVLERAF